jgi:hypothetical protein
VRREVQAWTFVLAWIGALIGLAVLWVGSPWTGPGPMFLSWSAPASLLFIVTWIWLGRLAIPEVPRGVSMLVTIVIVWTACVWLLGTGVAAEMALDADILRQPIRRQVALALEWLPGLFGLALSVAGLSAALEARYRVREWGESDPREAGR